MLDGNSSAHSRERSHRIAYMRPLNEDASDLLEFKSETGGYRYNDTEDLSKRKAMIHSIRRNCKRMIRRRTLRIFSCILLVILFIYFILPFCFFVDPIVWNVGNICSYKQNMFANNITTDIPDGRYFIAVNLHDSHKVAPHLLNQILVIAELIGASRVFVSIVESGSNDLTKQWLLLFAEVLTAHHIPNSIQTSNRNKQKQEPRIAFLSQMRNLAMAPLYQGKINHVDYILFINDIFMCSIDAIRLLQRVAQPNVGMSCGLDFDFVSSIMHNYDLKFYDLWVALDMKGNFLRGEYPYFQRATDQRLLRDSQPIPVYCCWNGMVAIKAALFYDGIRFRSASPGECRASECTLLCKDIGNSRYPNIIIDPAVAVAYEQQVFSKLTVEHPVGVGSFKSDGRSLINFIDNKPDTFECHGLAGSSKHPNIAPYRESTS